MSAMLTFLFSEMPKELVTFFIAMIPGIELKAAMPVAILKFGLSFPVAFVWSFLGSTIMGILMFVLLRFLLSKVKSKISFISQLWEKSIGKFQKRYGKKIEIGEACLMIFLIIVPVPGFGIFMAAVSAAILQLNYYKAASYLILGNFLAGGIVLAGIWGLKL